MKIQNILKTLLKDDVTPNHLTDVKWLLRYLDDGCPQGEPIFLSLGETWSHTPRKLSALLSKLPQYVHGYQLSMYGLPKLRRSMRNYLIESHYLNQSVKIGLDFEIAVTWSGTRDVMFDFGRLLIKDWESDNTPVVVTTAPGWDYAGVFEPLGFKVRNINLNSQNMFQPQISDWTKLIQQIKISGREQSALIIINAQHNPTGVNWSPNFVRELSRLAIRENIPVLIDDAYYGVCDPDCLPTSALKIWLEESDDCVNSKKEVWLAVRSFGKQFNSNGWAIGAIISSPQTLDRLVNNFRVQHQYNYGAAFQYAFSEWLDDQESQNFLKLQNIEVSNKRRFVKKFLETELGYQKAQIDYGNCTFYMLFPIPHVYKDTKSGTKQFLKDVFFHTGVLLSDAWAQPRIDEKSFSLNYVRLFLGADLPDIRRALERMKRAGISFNMKDHLTPVFD